MSVLPIAERELRVAVRQPKTWWRRVVTLLGALAICVFTYLVVGRFSTLSQIGGELFSGLGGFGIFYVLLAGPLATVDCLSRERREGTLGLLFLTDLKSYDVVLGKTAAASFDMVLGLTAILPLLSLPLLVGGISPIQYARLALGLADIMVLSLAAGVLASALSTSSRAALGITLLVLLFLTFGLILLGEGVFKIRTDGPVAPFFYSICPFYTAALCLDRPLRVPAWNYWMNIGGMHALSWLFLGVACRRTSTSWRDQPASKVFLRWADRLQRWRKGSQRLRSRWRRLMLDSNPIAWLEGRDHLQQRFLWASILVTAIWVALKHLYSAQKWPDDDALLLWPWWAHCVLCIWVMIQAPRRFAEDKQSGALELLLCTGLSSRQIVLGNMRALRRRYGRALLALIVLDVFLVFAHFRLHGGWKGLRHHELFQLFLWGALIFPFQLYSIARVGMCQGLVAASSVRASFAVFWRLGLLPWGLFLAFMLFCDVYGSHFKWLRVNDTLAYAAWGTCHFLPCAFFLVLANWNLNRHFRALAASTRHSSWRERWSRLLRLRPPAPRPTIRIQVQS